jgi:hypothetical protein
MGRLGNRVSAEQQGKLLASIHERVPIVTPDDQQSVQLRNAESEETFWANMREMGEQQIAGYEKLIAGIQHRIANLKAANETAAGLAGSARERIEKIRRGESVEGGLGREIDFERMLRQMGFSDKAISYMRLSGQLPEEVHEEYMSDTLGRLKKLDGSRTKLANWLRRRGYTDD